MELWSRRFMALYPYLILLGYRVPTSGSIGPSLNKKIEHFDITYFFIFPNRVRYIEVLLYAEQGNSSVVVAVASFSFVLIEGDNFG